MKIRLSNITSSFKEIKNWENKINLGQVFPVIYFKLKQKSNVIHFIWALPLVIFIRVIRKKINIQMINIGTTRIGHFYEDASNYYLDYVIKSNKCLNLFYFSPDSKFSNKFLKQMVKRNLNIVPKWFGYIDLLNRKIPGGEKHQIKPAQNRDTAGRFYKSDNKMRFTTSEDKSGKVFLESIGKNEKHKLVLLHIRDAAFLQKDPANLWPSIRSQNPWSHHDYRDSDIQNYVKAIKFLCENQNFVIRMGKTQESPVEFSHKNFFDYAFSDFKSDFLDVWLFAKADALITTVSGPSTISSLNSVPTLEINHLPSIDFRSFGSTLSAPKLLLSKSSGKMVTIAQHLSFDFYQTSDYVNNGLAVIDLTCDQIANITREFYLRLNDEWMDSNTDLVLVQNYWKSLLEQKRYSVYHKWLSPAATISTEWLRIVNERQIDLVSGSN